MSKDIRVEVKHIFSESKLGLYSFFFVLMIFSVGLFSLRNWLLSHVDGILKIILSFSLTIVSEAALSPLIVGGYEWIILLSRGKRTPMKNAFGRFSDLESIIESQRILFAWVFSARISIIPVTIMLIFTAHAGPDELYVNILFLIIAFIFSFRLLCGIFPLMHILINAPHISIFKALKLSFTAMSKNFGDFFRISCKLALLLALCVLTFGLFLVYALPNIFCTVVVYCDKVFEENKLYKYNLYY